MNRYGYAIAPFVVTMVCATLVLICGSRDAGLIMLGTGLFVSLFIACFIIVSGSESKSGL